MHPLVRSAVTVLSEKAGLLCYDKERAKPSPIHTEAVTTNQTPSQQGTDGNTDHEQAENLRILSSYLEERLTLFNVDEPFPDLRLEYLSREGQISVVDYLAKMKNLKVLYLGRWQESVQHHIEVDSTEFLKGLKGMEKLRFLSLQGISRITEVPSSIGKLFDLIILDLKACHNLEVLPAEIKHLAKLKYLDVSECYLLNRMPKGLSALSDLKVLKGFVIDDRHSGNSGTLKDLKGLLQLRKLSISTRNGNFPSPEDLDALNALHPKLEKLTIAWGGGSKPGDKTTEGKQDNRRKLWNCLGASKEGDTDPVALAPKGRSSEQQAGKDIPNLEQGEKITAENKDNDEQRSSIRNCLGASIQGDGEGTSRERRSVSEPETW